MTLPFVMAQVVRLGSHLMTTIALLSSVVACFRAAICDSAWEVEHRYESEEPG